MIYTDSVDALLTKETLKELTEKHYSDLLDADGHQYVDLVQEGGGVLGIALLGYTYVLERCGLRFWSLGGTSAGAINTICLAALGKAEDPKSLVSLKHLDALNLGSFMDGDPKVRDAINYARTVGMGLNFRTAKFFLNSDIFRFLDGGDPSDLIHQGWLDAYKQLGLNPGEAFTTWLESVLDSAGIQKYVQLEALLQKVPNGMHFRKTEDKEPEPFDAVAFPRHLRLVTADLITQSEVVLPEHAKLIWKEPKNVSPALFVRASMSIPFFFEPLRQKVTAKTETEDWKVVDYKGTPPEEVMFVDGGVVSNFPIALFHGVGEPKFPTFGIKLGFDRNTADPVADPIAMALRMFDLSKNSMDNHFLRTNPDYKQLVGNIDTGDSNWLNFDMEGDEKKALFHAGGVAAIDFLKKFKWEDYKQTRRDLANVHAPKTEETKQTAGVTAGG